MHEVFAIHCPDSAIEAAMKFAPVVAKHAKAHGLGRFCARQAADAAQGDECALPCTTESGCWMMPLADPSTLLAEGHETPTDTQRPALGATQQTSGAQTVRPVEA